MTLNELKRQVDLNIKFGHGESTVLITLDQPSVGASASCGIKGIYAGFDWESGQIRISPDKKICKRGNERDVPQQKHSEVIIGSNGKGRLYLFCPRCEERTKIESNWCNNCGQRLCN